MGLSPIHEEESECRSKRPHLAEAEEENRPVQRKARDILQSRQLPTYATNDVIVKRHAEMTTSKQPSNRDPVEYSLSLWLKAFKCGQV